MYSILKLDKNIIASADRINYIKELLAHNTYTPREIDLMSTYIVEANDQEQQKHMILTDNRMQTITKREMSLEQLITTDLKENNTFISSVEMKKKETKNNILCPKKQLTEKDYQNKYISQIEDTIKMLDDAIKNAQDDIETVHKIKSIRIDLKKEQFVIKEIINHTISFKKITFNKRFETNYYEPTGYIDKDNNYIFISDSSFYFSQVDHISALLQNYDMLKTQFENDVQSTMHWILIDFEKLIDYTFKNKPNQKYKDVIMCKMCGMSNDEINQYLIKEYGKGYSKMYISSLINSTLPILLVNSYHTYIYEWIHTFKLKGLWKKCTKCGKVKLATTDNFAKNKKGKYGLHSICKECR